MASCIECQLQFKVRFKDELHPTYPFAMPLGFWGMKYLVSTREKFSNYVEGIASRTKTTKGLCRFILEGIFSKYGSIRRMKVNQGELDATKAKYFFKDMV